MSAENFIKIFMIINTMSLSLMSRGLYRLRRLLMKEILILLQGSEGIIRREMFNLESLLAGLMSMSPKIKIWRLITRNCSMNCVMFKMRWSIKIILSEN